MRLRALVRRIGRLPSLLARLFQRPRRLSSAFTLVDRLFQLRDGYRVPLSRRPVRLGMLSLEDRVVPAAVGPQSYWDDGVYDSHGNKINVTVSLYNSGPGWLEVSGGGGAVSVSPGSPPSYGSGSGSGYPASPPPASPPPPSGSGSSYGSGSSGSGSSYGSGSSSGSGSGSGSSSGSGGSSSSGSGSGSGSSTSPPNPPNYSFSVSGALGPGSGDVTWSGGADSLYINATGDVSSISIGGDVYVIAGYTIGTLSGRDVSAQAGKSIAGATASDDVNSLSAGTSIGNITASDDIVTVSAGTSVGNAKAGGDVGSISAGKSTGSVTASGDIGTVYAGEDVGGVVSAGGDIGGVRKTENGFVGVAGTPYGGGGVSAGRNVAGSVSAGGNIASVRAGGQVQSKVTAGGDIFLVSGGGGYAYSEGSGSGSGGSPVPYAGGVLGSVSAGRDVRVVSAVNGDVVGGVSANRDVLAVNADGSVVGGVGAKNDVGKAATPNWSWSWLPSNPAYWPWWGWTDNAPLGAGVHAKTGSVVGNVSAGVNDLVGDVTYVSAGASVIGSVTAKNDVGSVAGGTGVSGAVDAGRDIGSVSAGWGSGYGSGSGGSANVSGPVTADRNINSVSASGNVSGLVDAGHGIGGVTAGGDISGAISAGAAVGRTDDTDPHLPRYHPYWSSYDNPFWGAGVQAGGNVTGTVDAGTDVSRVEAGGTVQGAITAGRDVGFVHGTAGVSAPIDASRDVGRVYAGGYGWVSTYYSSYWGELPNGAIGTISGTIDATGDIYGVYATGDITGTVTAGGGVVDVSAKGSITGDLTAGDGIGYLGELDGSGSGSGMYGGGGVTAGANVNAAIDAGGDVTFVRAGQNIAGTIDAGRDLGFARAAQNLSATITAGRDIGALSAGRLPGYVYPTGTVPGLTGSITGDATVGRDIRSVTATGDIDATITAGHAIGGVYAQGDIGGTLEATSGPIGRLTDEPVYNPYDPYESYRFPYSSEADAPGRVHADGDIDADITAGGDITKVDAKGSISGTITSGRDITAVIADHSIDADISADHNITDVKAGVDAPPAYYDYGTSQWVQPPGVTGDVTGSIDAGRDLTTVKATGSIDADVSVGNRVTTVQANLDVSGSVDAGEDVVTVKAGRHVHATVDAGRDVREVRAGTAGTWEYDPDTGDYEETGGTPGDVTGDVTADRDVVSVSATRDVTGNVTGTHTVGRVAAGRSVTGDVTATNGSVGRLEDDDPRLPWFRPYAYYYSTPNPYVTGYLEGGVHAGQDVSGAVTAGTDVSMVEALDGEVNGAIDAGRDVGWVHGTTGVSSDITAGRDVGAVYAGAYEVQYGGGWGRVADADPADFTGSVDATGGIATVEATGSVLGDVTAGDSIGYLGLLTQDPGDEPDDEDRFFGTGVWAGLDVDAALDAGGDVHAVTAGRDIAGSITAGRDVCALDAPRDMAADVDAGRDVGQVEAGRDMAGDLTAGRDVGNVTSGYYNGGSISGDIDAGEDVGRVTAYGDGGRYGSPSTLPLVEDAWGDSARRLDIDLWTIDADADQYDAAALTDKHPDAPVLPTGGDITGSVTAGEDIGRVVAFGKIEGDIEAGGSIGDADAAVDLVTGVWAVEAITGDITAGAGDLVVRGWDTIEGAVTAEEHLRAWAYNELSGDLESRASDTLAGSWDSLTGGAKAQEWVDVRAFNDVGREGTQYVSTASPPSPGDPNIGLKSTADAVRVWAGRSMFAPGEAEKYFAVFAVLSATFTEPISSNTEDTYVQTEKEDITLNNSAGSPLSAKDLAWLIAGRDIKSGFVVSTDGSVVLDATKAISGISAGAKQNVWAAARDGGLNAGLGAEGWVYAWAKADVAGTLRAKGKVSATSFGSLSAEVESTEDGIDAYAAQDVTGKLTGKKWIDVEAGRNLTSEVKAGDDTTASNIYARVGGNVTSPTLFAGGAVEANVTGNVQGTTITAKAGNLELTVDGNVSAATGTLTAADEAEVWVGGTFVQRLTAADVKLTAGVDAVGSVTAQSGDALVRAGRNISLTAKASQAVVIEAGGTVAGSYDGGRGGVSVVAGGDISGTYIADWVVDVRSSNGVVAAAAVTTTRRNRNDWLNAADSPYKKRLVSIQAEKATLVAAGQGNSPRAKEIDGQLEIMTGQPSYNLNDVSKGTIADLVDNGMGYVAQGVGPNNDRREGYVIVVDAVGNQLSVKIFEPLKDGQPIAGQVAAYTRADNFRLVFQVEGQPADVPGQVEWLRQPANAQAYVERWAQQKAIVRQDKLVDFGLHLIPLVSAVENFEKGNYFEAALDLAGDVATLTGLGAVSAGARCVVAGARLQKTIKIATTMSMAIDGGLAAVSAGRGFTALFSEDPTERQKAWGYFGDATLRLFGLSLNAIAAMRKRTCFVAGTPVHTETGLRPIESLAAGDRVWSFDPRRQAWVLADVTLAFRRTSFELLTLQLDNGDVVTGTPEHPFWVIEGQTLEGRPAPTHGGDEDWSRVPGRWVDLGELKLGDVVLTRHGRTAQVLDAVRRAAVEPVYNVEVGGLRNYAIGLSGVLTHNYGTDDASEAAARSVPKAPDAPPANAGGPSARTPEVTTPTKTSKAKTNAPPPNRMTQPEIKVPAAAITAGLKDRWENLARVYGHEVLESVIKGVEGSGPAIKQNLDNLEKVINNLKAHNWANIRPSRRLETDDQIKNALQMVFVNNTQPGAVYSRINRQDLLRDLAEISHLPSFQRSLRSLRANNVAKAKGTVAEVQVAAADRRAGMVVEDVGLDVRALGKPTDIDVVSGGTLWQIKVGDCPSKIELAAQKVEYWVQQAAEVAAQTGKTKIGFRLDADSRKWFNHKEVQDKLAELRAKYQGKFTIEVPDVNIPTPTVP